MSGAKGWRSRIHGIGRPSTDWARVRQDETIIVIVAFLICVLLNGIGTIIFFELIK